MDKGSGAGDFGKPDQVARRVVAFSVNDLLIIEILIELISNAAILGDVTTTAPVRVRFG